MISNIYFHSVVKPNFTFKMISVRWLVTILGQFLVLQKIQACNEATCRSVVTLCLLTGECKCESGDDICRSGCLKCLRLRAEDCCSCVDMCTYPLKNFAPKILSHTKKLHAYPELFTALMEYPEREKRWESFTYQIQIVEHINERIEDKLIGTKNCTVAFISTCSSHSDCKATCQNMGASGYRWFHNGCCECVGEQCVSYGINRSKCRKCPHDLKESPIEQ